MCIKDAPDLCEPNRWAVANVPTFLKCAQVNSHSLNS